LQLIIETIQGEGGDNHFRPEFFKQLRALADKHEFLLIFDEVQTGFGTTGKWWAFEHIGVQPDIFSFGKKTQVCGIACTRRIDDIPDNVFKVSSRINSTWGGNLVDMVRCQRIVEIVQEDKLLEHSANIGKLLVDGLVALEERYPEVTNSRGLGMFVAFDLPDGEVRKDVLAHLRDCNVLVLTSGSRSLRLRTALTMTAAEANTVLERIDEALNKIFKRQELSSSVDSAAHEI
jgi:L-lysine 6-transaminase